RFSRDWSSDVCSSDLGHRLEQLGIATAAPLAVRERRFCGLRGPAWLITEYVAGTDALSHLAPFVDGGLPQAELSGLQQLFAALRSEERRVGRGGAGGG